MTTKGKMSKREIRAQLQERYDDMVLEAKLEAINKSWLPLENFLNQIPKFPMPPIDLIQESEPTQAADTYKLIKDLEAASAGAHNWNAMENYLKGKKD
jgi:hypothetical protein